MIRIRQKLFWSFIKSNNSFYFYVFLYQLRWNTVLQWYFLFCNLSKHKNFTCLKNVLSLLIQLNIFWKVGNIVFTQVFYLNIKLIKRVKTVWKYLKCHTSLFQSWSLLCVGLHTLWCLPGGGSIRKCLFMIHVEKRCFLVVIEYLKHLDLDVIFSQNQHHVYHDCDVQMKIPEVNFFCNAIPPV